MNVQPLSHIPKLHAYTPGLQPAEPGWIKLNTNELPYPPSPKVAEAIVREVGADGASLRLYPDPRSVALRRAIAAHHGLKEEQVCVGNGSDDLLNLLARCFCSPRSAGAFTVPSYSLYPVLIAIQDGGAEAIEFGRSLSLPVERIAGSKARIVFLTSPNAPTGVAFEPDQLEAVLSRFQGILVVDEAYAPFASGDAIGLLRKHKRVVILRTFSKAYALAGMRIGYALADPEVIGLLDRVRDSYNVSRLAQAAGLAALADPGYYASMVAKVCATRDRVRGEWAERRGWFVYPSQSNFLFVEPVDSSGRTGAQVSAAAYEFLLDHKILVRRFPSHALTESFLRVSVGTDAEMAALDNTLDAWLKAPPHAQRR